MYLSSYFKLSTLILLLCSAFQLFGQQLPNPYTNSPTVGEYIAAHDAYWEEQILLYGEEAFESEGSPYGHYQKWKRETLQRFQPGDLLSSGQAQSDFLNENPVTLYSESTNWVEIGPRQMPDQSLIDIGGAGGEVGIGPVNFVSLSPDYASTGLMFTGSWSSGLFLRDNANPVWHQPTSIGSLTGSISVSDCKANPFNEDNWFMCDGAGDGLFSNGPLSGDVRSKGVYRTNDRGETWETICDPETDLGVTDWIFQIKKILLVKLDATSELRMFISTSHGVFMTNNPNDETVIWEPVLEAGDLIVSQEPAGYYYSKTNFFDLDFIAQPTTECPLCGMVVATASKLFVENGENYSGVTCNFDNGQMTCTVIQSSPSNFLDIGNSGTWNEYALSADITDHARIEIDYSAADPDHFYLHAADCSEAQVFKYNHVNGIETALDDIMPWDEGGSCMSADAFAVSPTNSSKMFVIEGTRPGLAVSYDNGQTFDFIDNDNKYHDDVEDVVFTPDGSKIFVATHGGIYTMDIATETWTPDMDGLGVAEVMGFSNQRYSGRRMSIGLFHDGTQQATNYLNTEDYEMNWRQVSDGDGSGVIVPNYDNVTSYHTVSWTKMYRNDNGYSSIDNDVDMNLAGPGSKEGQFALNHFDEKIFYSEKRNIRRHFNGGSDVNGEFDIISDFLELIPWMGDNYIPSEVAFGVYPSTAHQDLLFATAISSRFGHYYMTVCNKATQPVEIAIENWTVIPWPSDFQFANGTWVASMASDPLDPNVFYVLTGATTQQQMYKYTFVGDVIEDDITEAPEFVIENITFNLSGVHVDEIYINAGSDDVWLATDEGTFHSNLSSLDANIGATNDPDVWEQYGMLLPHTRVGNIDFNYNQNKLRVGSRGRGVWEHPLPCEKIETAYELNNDEQLRLTTPTRWRQDIIVNDGAILIIESEAYFAEHCGIKVKPGGRLYLNEGAHLMNACDAMWTGIEIWGDESVSQLQPNQGYVIANDCVIENAHAGIWVRENDQDCEYVIGSGGGVARMDEVHFLNCYNGAVFAPYVWFNNGDEQKNKSYFNSCTFETSKMLLGGIAPKSGITLEDVYGIDILGCEFKNTALDGPDAWFFDDVSKNGIGIISYDSYFKCGQACAMYDQETCIEFSPCEFTTLEEGIRSLHTLVSYPIEVFESNFTGNQIGIRVEGADHARILFNNIVLTDVSNNSFNYPLAGIDIEAVEHFDLQENNIRFEGLSPLAPAYGLALTSNDHSDKMVYRNNFDNLTEAIHVQGRNGQNAGDDVPSGIQLLCNNFGQAWDVNERDINLIEFIVNGNNYQTSLNPEQGQLGTGEYSAAGNLFSQSCINSEADFRVDLMNTWSNSFINYYQSDIPEEQLTPNCFTAQRITPLEAPQNQTQCTAQFTPETTQIIGSPDIIWEDGVAGENESYLETYQVYLGKLDKGDPNALKAFILDPLNSSAEVRNEMLSCVPHISLDSWKNAFMRVPSMDPWHISQVLLASSPLKQSVIDMMYTYGLDAFYRQLVLDGQNGGVTSQLVFQNELTNQQLYIRNNYGDFISATMLPSDSLNESSKTKLKLEANPEFDPVLLASLLIQREDYAAAITVIDDFALTLNSNDKRDDVLRILAESPLQNGSCDRFTSSQKLELTNIANSRKPGYVAARTALAKEFIEFEGYWDAMILESGSSRAPSRVEERMDETLENPFMDIKPNPSGADASLIVSLPEGSKGVLEIFDQYGRLVQSRSTLTKSTIKTLDANNLSSGIYICTLVIDNQLTSTIKWVVQK